MNHPMPPPPPPPPTVAGSRPERAGDRPAVPESRDTPEGRSDQADYLGRDEATTTGEITDGSARHRHAGPAPTADPRARRASSAILPTIEPCCESVSGHARVLIRAVTAGAVSGRRLGLRWRRRSSGPPGPRHQASSRPRGPTDPAPEPSHAATTRAPSKCSSGGPHASDEYSCLANGAVSRDSATHRADRTPRWLTASPTSQVDVAERLGEVAGLAVERVAVQQQHRHSVTAQQGSSSSGSARRRSRRGRRARRAPGSAARRLRPRARRTRPAWGR